MIGLGLFLAAAASALPISYTETFSAGNDVDLHQAFYVCKGDNPRDLMETLMDIKSDNLRRAFAEIHGCPFVLKDHAGPIYKVVAETATTCMDRQVYGKMIVCGREGHQLIVKGQDGEKTVIQLSLDIDYD